VAACARIAGAAVTTASAPAQTAEQIRRENRRIVGHLLKFMSGQAIIFSLYRTMTVLLALTGAAGNDSDAFQ
jgi:hypothetical protein